MDESTWRMLCLVVLVAPALRIASAEEIKISMPNVQPQQNDLYLCIDKKIDDLKYITGFKPTASMQVAHHILIYGCSEPGGSGGSPWNCGEMHQGEKGMFQSGPVCKDSGRIIYAWAMDAPELTLPNDVAFKIGGETAMKYLVMQVHYKDVTRFLPPSLEKDNSGVILTATDIPRAKTAGVYLVAANGKLSPRSVTYMEAACSFQEALTLHPFAYRVHSHKLGKVVSGYRVRDGEWTEIGRMSPQKPQMFYPVEDSQLEINPGDIIAARCTMENKGHKTVAVGPTSDDEMCNFYIMYYVSGDQDVKDPICTSPGPPHWNWKFFDGIHAENAPPQASADPETNDWFEETKQFINNVHETLTRENENLRKHLDDTFKNLWSSKPIVPKFEFPSQSFASPNFASEFSSPNFANPKFASEFADPNFASPKFPSAFSSLNFPSPKFPSDLFSDSSYADTYDNGFKSYGQPDYDGYNVENNDYLNGEQQFGFYQKPENPSGPHLFTNFKVQEIPGGSSYSSRRIKFNRQNNKGLGYFSRAGSEQKRFPAFEGGDDDSSDDDAIKLNFPKMPSAKPIPKMENLQLVFPKMPEVQKIRKLPKIMVNNENDGNHTEHANKGNLTRTEESGHVPPADDGYENIPSAEDTPEVEEVYSNEIPSEEGDSEVDVEESEEESDRIEPKIAAESKDAAGFSKDDPFAPKVQSSEILHTFDDKQGGKGYSSNKVENSYQELNIPGGKGFVKSHSRSKAAGYHKSKTTVT